MDIITSIQKYLSSKTQNSHVEELFKGSFIAFSYRIVGGILGYVFILLITRNLGADAMGVYALSLTLINVFALFGKLGFNGAMLRFVAEYTVQGRKDLVKEAYLKTLKVVIPASISLSFTLFILSPYISEYIFKKPDISYYLKISSLAILPMVLMLVNAECLRGLKKIKEYSFLMNISLNLFASTIIFILLMFFKNNVSPLISYIASLFIVTFISHMLWQKNARLKYTQKSDSISMRSMFDVAIPMLLSGSLITVMGWTDTLLLGIFKTTNDIGVYNVAARIAAVTTITLVAINSIAAPKFAEFYGKNDISNLELIAKKSTKLIFWTSFPIILAIFLFPSFILSLFGVEFKTGKMALIFLAFGQFINSISGSVGIILQMTGLQKLHQNIMLITTAINVILNIILIPRFGINGAAFATSFSLCFWNLTMVYYIYKRFKFLILYIPKIFQA